jgi:hypothetical protein
MGDRVMPVEIPDLYSVDVAALTTCGEITTKNKRLHKWASDHDAHYYYYRHPTAGGDLAVRVSLDSSKDKEQIHFHVDILSKDWFVNDQLPPASEDVPPLEDLLAPFRGQTIEIDVSMDLPVALSQVPSAIAVVANQAAREDKITLRMTGGVVSVDGAPSVDTIRWTVDPNDDKRVFISLSGKATAKFSDTYFRECFILMLTYVNTFFRLGGTHA